MTLVSVLIPVLDATHLATAVGSILNQSISSLEVIIIDDGSPDAVGNYVAQLADRRVIYERLPENIGTTKALNVGMDIASGEFIARQDADDWSHPERLAKQIAAWESGVGLIAVWAQCVTEGGQPLADHYFDTETRIPETEIAEALLSANCIVGGTGMWPRGAMEAIGYQDETLWFGQDYNYWLRLARSFTVKVVPSVLYYHRRWPGSRRKTQGDMADVNGRELDKVCIERSATHQVIRTRQ